MEASIHKVFVPVSCWKFSEAPNPKFSLEARFAFDSNGNDEAEAIAAYACVKLFTSFVFRFSHIITWFVQIVDCRFADVLGLR